MGRRRVKTRGSGRIPFLVTLLVVGAAAIVVGYMMGTYAIRLVTAPPKQERVAQDTGAIHNDEPASTGEKSSSNPLTSGQTSEEQQAGRGITSDATTAERERDTSERGMADGSAPSSGSNQSGAPPQKDSSAGEDTKEPVVPVLSQSRAPGASTSKSGAGSAGSDQASSAPAGPDLTEFRVQIGAFGTRERADGVAAQLRLEKYPVTVSPAGTMFRVQVGPVPGRDEAKALLDELKAKGYPEAYIVR